MAKVEVEGPVMLSPVVWIPPAKVEVAVEVATIEATLMVDVA